jgi:glycosyltransferase involved in cell wall biosynthesis
MNSYDKIAILIPAYNPDHKLPELVNDIIKAKYKNIIIVNDGSKSECNEIFNLLSQHEECTVLTHHVNQGKGQALKTGFTYFLDNFGNAVGLVTVDADGQHAIEDSEELYDNPNSFVLGVRDFSAENIPFRSRFGNVLTKSVFKFTSGLKVSDTQTGLRGISSDFAKKLLRVPGERYEFEMNMLLECKTYKIEIKEVKIKTIYIEENKSSHFNPIVDSIKIYSVFFKFISSSLLSFGVDILLFTIFIFFLKDIMPHSYIIGATILSRVLSSLINYSINKNAVFKSKGKNTIVKYYILSVVQMLTSAFGVYILFSLLGTGEVVIKIVVDTLLFLLSFVIQREWVFKSNQVDFVR